jgi:hypothetical protein
VVDDAENKRKLFVKAKNNLSAAGNKGLAYHFGGRVVGKDAETVGFPFGGRTIRRRNINPFGLSRWNCAASSNLFAFSGSCWSSISLNTGP